MMSGIANDIVIIGGSHGRGEAAFRLRQGGLVGSITLLSAEAYLPYHRPPLSKAILVGEVTADSLVLRWAEAYAKQNIAWHPKTTVTSIASVDHLLNLADSSKLGYGKLIIATGGRPRTLPGAELGGIHVLRSIADVDKLRPEFPAGKRLIIVGAAYVGVAAVAIKTDLDVEIVEFASRTLARVAGPELSSFCEGVRTKAGVKSRFNTGVEGFLAANHDSSRVGVVRCSGGVDLPAALPERQARAPRIRPQRAGAYPRHSLGAERQPGRVQRHAEWFWSDQYRYKLQSRGLSQGYDRTVIRLPKNLEGFIVFYLQGDKVIAANCVSAMVEFNTSKKLVTEKIPSTPPTSSTRTSS